MKRFLIIAVAATFVGCSDFLDEVDQDKLIPEKTEHYSALMLQEFNSEYPIFTSIDHMTDNVTEDPTASSLRKMGSKTTYTWQREIEIDENGNNAGGLINRSWEKMYEDIAIMNYVLEQSDDALGAQGDINYIKGEAYFIRALSYFNLLNLYGQPFDPASANTDLGVPLRDNIGVESTYNRNTVAECYAFIEEDLNQAMTHIADSNGPVSVWHPGLTACELLMSRVKLYQEKWDEAATYAGSVIQNANLSKISTDLPFVRAENPEILYSYYTVSPLFRLFDYGTTLGEQAYRAAPELVNSYVDGDIRREAFFHAIDDGSGRNYYRTKKYQVDLYTTLGFANLRVAEAYLNRAEAYAQQGDVANAVNDIKTLHASRFTNTASVTYPSSQEEVLVFVLEERRRELCFEDHHRWFDLRRMADRPEIKHVYSLIEEDGTKLGTETYTLLSDDLNYTLPIPLKERQNNPLIRNNERYEKIPVIDEEIIID